MRTMRAQRLVALLFTLQSRRSATIAELAEAVGVSERTMHRDIAALQEAGVPLWTETGRHGGVRLVDGWRSRLDGLTSREAVAIFAMGVPRALADLGLGTAVSAARAKVTATLPAQLREQAQHVAQRFHLDAPAWFRGEDTAEHLADLAAAVWDQRRVRLFYRRDDREVDRVAEPLGLVLKAGVWYLAARVGADVRTYRVGRIVGLEELDEGFDRPADFDLASWWERASATFERSLTRQVVRVRVSQRGVRILRTILEPEVVAESLDRTQPDADGWTELELPMQKPDIAAGQLLSLGAEVEVLAPQEVRDRFTDTVRRMAQRHAVDPADRAGA